MIRPGTDQYSLLTDISVVQWAQWLDDIRYLLTLRISFVNNLSLDCAVRVASIHGPRGGSLASNAGVR